MRRALDLCTLPPQAYNPSSIMRENRQTQIEGHFRKYPTSIPQNSQGHEK